MKYKQASKGLNNFADVTYTQAEKGYKKYKKELDPLEPGRNWLQMQAEEQADSVQYRQAMEDRVEFVVDKIKMRTDDVEIHYYLDFLEGK